MTELLNETQDETTRAALAERLGLEGDPGDFGAWMALGRALAAKARFRDAAEAVQEAISIRPEDVGALNMLAGHLLASQRSEEAVEVSRRALAIRLTDYGALRRLCSALLQLKRHEEAVPEAERMVAAAPEDAEAYLLQAVVLHPIDAEGARAARATAAAKARAQVEADGSKLPPRIGLAKALASLESWEEAAEAAQAASAMKPEDAGLHNMVATFLLRVGRREEALAEAQSVLAARENKTMNVYPGDETTALRRSVEALLQLKRPAEALPLARQLLERQPGDAGVKRLHDAAEAAPEEAATVAAAATPAQPAPATEDLAPKGKGKKAAAPEGEKLDRRKLKKQEARGQSKPPKRGPR
ncbi:tetratricopeptide repeat protein [Roseomonas elaeocarpi]|uniref:Tetratricopeptide repeat protein n=1 Tax=Roseomonas elaeocarpi TaxID=907779 RepID=A0ABV6JXV3_9PROT